MTVTAIAHAITKSKTPERARVVSTENCGGNSGRETFRLASSISPNLPEIIGRGEARNKFCNYLEDSLIDILLGFVRQVFFADEHGMVAAFDNVLKIRRDHFRSNAFE